MSSGLTHSVSSGVPSKEVEIEKDTERVNQANLKRFSINSMMEKPIISAKLSFMKNLTW